MSDNNTPLNQLYDVKKEAEKNTFGKRLCEARRAKNWSIKTLTEKLGDYNIHLTPASVNKWELGMTTPNPYQVSAICRLLEIEDGIRYFSGPLHNGESALNERGLKKLEEYRKDLIATGLYSYDNVEEPNAEK